MTRHLILLVLLLSGCDYAGYRNFCVDGIVYVQAPYTNFLTKTYPEQECKEIPK